MRRIATCLLCACFAAASAQAQNQIKNIVVIFQENRTPDGLFHGLPGADIANTGKNSKGQLITLQPIPLANNYDVNHAHPDFVAMYDNGKMDGADKIKVSCLPTAKHCPPPNAQFRYVEPSEVAPYFQLAEQYAFADRMFQTNQGPSFPAHQYIVSGTSTITKGSALRASESPILPGLPSLKAGGCDSPAGTMVALIDAAGSESQKAFPCFERPALTDLLQAKGLSW